VRWLGKSGGAIGFALIFFVTFFIKEKGKIILSREKVTRNKYSHASVAVGQATNNNSSA
jgi:hypothetical protein